MHFPIVFTANSLCPSPLQIQKQAMDGFSMEKPDKAGTRAQSREKRQRGSQDGKMSLMEGLKPAMMPALVIGVQHDVPPAACLPPVLAELKNLFLDLGAFPSLAAEGDCGHLETGELPEDKGHRQPDLAVGRQPAGGLLRAGLCLWGRLPDHAVPLSWLFPSWLSPVQHDSFLLDAVAIGPAVKGICADSGLHCKREPLALQNCKLAGHLEQEPEGARHLWEAQCTLTQTI